jgi:hypothetical protein
MVKESFPHLSAVFPATVSCAIDEFESLSKGTTMLLNGWKEISNHVQRGVRTVQRWEHLGLPVVRINNSVRSPVLARSEELDRWLLRHSSTNPQPQPLLLAKYAQARRAELRTRAEALIQRSAELIQVTKRLQARSLNP